MKAALTFRGTLLLVALAWSGGSAEGNEDERFLARLARAEKLQDASGEAGRDATSFLRGYLEHPGGHPGAIERARAALALFRLDPESGIARSTLIELLSFIRESDDSVPDYLGIARGLERLGPKARPLYPALMLDALTDTEPATRKIDIDTLSRVIPDRADLLAELAQTVTQEWDPQSVASRIKPSSKALRAEILAALSDPNPLIRQRAVRVVGLIPSPDATMRDRLKELTSDPDSGVSREAQEAVRRVSGES